MPEIAIDACVFVHLLNPQNNKDSHIDRLLRQLIKDSFMLLMDSTGRIGKDYEAQVKPMIKSTSDTGGQLYLLRYWMQNERRVTVQLDQTDRLMAAIRNIIFEVAEHADRAFVYVACRRNATLVTNDAAHILDRRSALLKKTKRWQGNSTDILSSINAASHFCHNGGQS